MFVLWMISGSSPYSALADEIELADAVLRTGPNIPKVLSAEGRGLVSQLLASNPVDRLGSGPNGADEITGHTWFAEIDWDAMFEGRAQAPTTLLARVVAFEGLALNEFEL